MPKKLTEKEKEEVIELYKQGNWTMKLLGEKFSCSSTIIRNCLIENNIPIRVRTLRKNLNMIEDYFSVIDSEEKAYFLGLIFTDGNLYNNELSLELGVKDLEILQRFKEALNLGGKISYRKRKNTEVVCIRATSQFMASDLRNLGVVERKTKNATHIPVVPDEFKKDLIRGMIDGDGHIMIYPFNNSVMFGIGFCSYKQSIAEEVKKECESLINESLPKIRKDKGKEIYRFECRTKRQVKQLVTVLYKDSNIYLTRKYLKAEEIFEYKNDEDIV